ncbi:hypothetical protein ACFY7H_23490 [Streptomyces sp. NPDC012794]|uniref:hypothetical protein n=1 Tax=Streptomyces sp. NPDC012794 TaxID=3364850 RepID=UPI00368D8B9E
MIRLRRVYDPPEPGADGVRVLVDRLREVAAGPLPLLTAVKDPAAGHAAVPAEPLGDADGA